ncbi:hypothetical protein VSS37_05830 [Candidatus Thiothrix sp. Deng01]|uniref:Uncharacterized protein n=1 Tax=Candidatus Thiothrix phosphatis TaxID=3112415 RepID=A0ABU6CUI9_9GAMM|nr:hypothetical protein [Candidatus Thiothrix sp. Deng01]MEB4590491.1 hypothetical protein [Candidatus Thiothrix sp. Deng01]
MTKAKQSPQLEGASLPDAPDEVGQVVFTTGIAGDGFSFSPGIHYPLSAMPFSAAEMERLVDGGLAKLV